MFNICLFHAAEGEKNAKTTEIGHLKQSLENFRLEIKDIQHDKLVKEQSLKNGFDADKTRYTAWQEWLFSFRKLSR